ncbi:hypothetical protein ACFVZR_23095 [Streptomyces sp. NPDC058316]
MKSWWLARGLWSKSYHYSHHHVVVDSEIRLVVDVGRPVGA